MKSIFKKITISLIMITLMSIGAIGGYTYYEAGKLSTNISKSKVDLGIDENMVKELEGQGFSANSVTNIALFGIDSREADSSGRSRSDSIIILSIDKVHNKIKLSSVLRDTRVKIEGHGHDKITHAYSFGGPQLAVKTLNQNFGLNIENFVTVDFFGLEKIIDSIGGIELDVKKSEINEINKYIKEVAVVEKKTPTLLTTEGLQTLNGMQAVSFGRIRHVGNGDYERTDRQREVIMAMFSKSQSLGIIDCANLIKNSSEYVKTSLSPRDMVAMGINVLSSKGIQIEQKRFPENGDGGIVRGVWYFVADLDVTKQDMKNFIYELGSGSSDDATSNTSDSNGTSSDSSNSVTTVNPASSN